MELMEPIRVFNPPAEPSPSEPTSSKSGPSKDKKNGKVLKPKQTKENRKKKSNKIPKNKDKTQSSAEVDPDGSKTVASTSYLKSAWGLLTSLVSSSSKDNQQNEEETVAPLQPLSAKPSKTKGLDENGNLSTTSAPKTLIFSDPSPATEELVEASDSSPVDYLNLPQLTKDKVRSSSSFFHQSTNESSTTKDKKDQIESLQTSISLHKKRSSGLFPRQRSQGINAILEETPKEKSNPSTDNPEDPFKGPEILTGSHIRNSYDSLPKHMNGSNNPSVKKHSSTLKLTNILYHKMLDNSSSNEGTLGSSVILSKAFFDSVSDTIRRMKTDSTSTSVSNVYFGKTESPTKILPDQKSSVKTETGDEVEHLNDSSSDQNGNDGGILKDIIFSEQTDGEGGGLRHQNSSAQSEAERKSSLLKNQTSCVQTQAEIGLLRGQFFPLQAVDEVELLRNQNSTIQTNTGVIYTNIGNNSIYNSNNDPKESKGNISINLTVNVDGKSSIAAFPKDPKIDSIESSMQTDPTQAINASTAMSMPSLDASKKEEDIQKLPKIKSIDQQEVNATGEDDDVNEEEDDDDKDLFPTTDPISSGTALNAALTITGDSFKTALSLMMNIIPVDERDRTEEEMDIKENELVVSLMRAIGIPKEMRHNIYQEACDELETLQDVSSGTVDVMNSIVQWVIGGEVAREDLRYKTRAICAMSSEVEMHSEVWNNLQHKVDKFQATVEQTVNDGVEVLHNVSRHCSESIATFVSSASSTTSIVSSRNEMSTDNELDQISILKVSNAGSLKCIVEEEDEVIAMEEVKNENIIMKKDKASSKGKLVQEGYVMDLDESKSIFVYEYVGPKTNENIDNFTLEGPNEEKSPSLTAMDNTQTYNHEPTFDKEMEFSECSEREEEEDKAQYPSTTDLEMNQPSKNKRYIEQDFEAFEKDKENNNTTTIAIEVNDTDSYKNKRHAEQASKDIGELEINFSSTTIIQSQVSKRYVEPTRNKVVENSERENSSTENISTKSYNLTSKRYMEPNKKAVNTLKVKVVESKNKFCTAKIRPLRQVRASGNKEIEPLEKVKASSSSTIQTKQPYKNKQSNTKTSIESIKRENNSSFAMTQTQAFKNKRTNTYSPMSRIPLLVCKQNNSVLPGKQVGYRDMYERKRNPNTFKQSTEDNPDSKTYQTMDKNTRDNAQDNQDALYDTKPTNSMNQINFHNQAIETVNLYSSEDVPLDAENNYTDSVNDLNAQEMQASLCKFKLNLKDENGNNYSEGRHQSNEFLNASNYNQVLNASSGDVNSKLLREIPSSKPSEEYECNPNSFRNQIRSISALVGQSDTSLTSKKDN